jgi:SLOG in TRPM, prokaryote
MRHERIGDAKAVRIAAFGELGDAAAALGLDVGVPVLVVVGGADLMSRAEEARVNALIEALVPHLDRLGGALVDGGTATGVMRAAGDARMTANGHFPLIGVVVDALARRPGDGARDGTNLDRGHTHFAFVPGADWGDESPWLARFAATLAGPASSATLLANGGDIAWKDAEHSIELDRRVIAAAGTGRAADELAAGRTERARALQATGLVDVVAIKRGAEAKAAAAVARALAG